MTLQHLTHMDDHLWLETEKSVDILFQIEKRAQTLLYGDRSRTPLAPGLTAQSVRIALVLDHKESS